MRSKLLIALLLCFLAVSSDALVVVQRTTTLGEGENEYGYTEIGATSGNTVYDARCIKVTIDDTISHGYFYAESADATPDTFYIVIREDDSGVGDAIQCSDSGTLPAAGSIGWQEVTFTPAVVVDATVWICAYAPQDKNYRYDLGGNSAEHVYDELWDSCDDATISPSGSSRQVSLKVTNYDAH